MVGSELPILAAHGEGQLTCNDPSVIDQLFRQQLVSLQYIDDYGHVTTDYPFNPNGSPQGIAGLCSPDGRFLGLMPHPERLFQLWQWPWMSEEWKRQLHASPWMQVFQNAADWCRN